MTRALSLYASVQMEAKESVLCVWRNVAIAGGGSNSTDVCAKHKNSRFMSSESLFTM